MERDEQSHYDDDIDQCQPPEELGDVVRIIGWLEVHWLKALRTKKCRLSVHVIADRGL